VASAGRQGHDVKPLDATLARLEFRFGLGAAAELFDGVAVFRTEALRESIGLLSAVEEPRRERQHC